MKGAVHLCSMRLLLAAAACNAWKGPEPGSLLSPFAMRASFASDHPS